MGSNAAPDFLERLQSQSIRQGESVFFSIKVSGSPAPVVRWFREGMEIQSAGDFIITAEGNLHTLKITNPYPEDTGVFTVTATNASGKATSTAHLAVDAASSDEEFAIHKTSTKKVMSKTIKEEKSMSATMIKSSSSSSSKSSKKLPPGINPTDAMNQFASVFKSAEAGLKKTKKVKKVKVTSSAETEYETVAETETEAFTETETEMSSLEQITQMRSKSSPQVPRKPTAVEMIKKPQIEIQSPLQKRQEIKGFRSVKPTTGKVHQISASKKVDIQINQQSSLNLYETKFNPGGGVVRHVNAPSGPRSRETSLERHEMTHQVMQDSDAGEQTEYEMEQVEVDEGGDEEVEVASIASTPEPDETGPVEDMPQDPFPPRFEIPPEDAGVIEGDIAILQATISAWPEPEIRWYREGATIENCADYQVTYEDGIAQLLIRNCYPDDAGKFTVSARNQMGASSATCILSVKSTSECDREMIHDKFDEVYEESAQEGSGTEVSEPDTTDVDERKARESQVLSPVVEGPESLGVLSSPASPTRHHQSPEQVLDAAMQIVQEAEQRMAATSPTMAAPNQAQQVLLPSQSPLPPTKSGAPRFLSVPDRCILLQEGATQVFEACAPHCHVFWERDGKPIIGGYRMKVSEDEKAGSASITINMVFPEDAGEYVAVAANKFGKTQHSVFFLTTEHYTAFMRKGGEVPTGLTDYTASSSDEMTDRSGRKQTREELKNIKKGVGIRQSQSPLTRRSPSPSGMRNVSKSPARAPSPGAGRLSTLDPKDMSKVYKPVFLVKATNLEVLEGKSSRINIRITGRPPPLVEWFRNGEPICEDETHRITIQENGVQSLIFDAVTEYDSAEYSVVASNIGGKAVSACRFTVLPAEEAQRPRILDKPTSTKVRSGESVRLEVFAVGRPTPEICWLKDNQLLQPEKHTNYQFEGVDGHGLLIIEAANRQHDGWYTATAVNKAGRDLCRCKLTVANEEKVEDERAGRLFKAGKKGQKKADASPGRHTGKLTRAPEDFDEADLYDKTKAQKPMFRKKIDSVKTKTLGEAHFECRLVPIGDPTMKVQWLIDGKQLDNANRIQTMFEFGYTSLDITSCYPRDTGVISCRAINAHGGAETSATLIVKEDRSTTFQQAEGRAMELIKQKEKMMRPTSESPPYAMSPTKEMAEGALAAPLIQQAPEDFTTSEGQTMRFHCRATGNPAPKVEWYLNGQQIRKSKRFQLWNDGLHYLEINPARAYDTGSLVAVAVNKAGQAQASCTVDVEPLGDLRSNLKRVDGSSPDASLRAMRMDRKVQNEKNTEILEEVQLRRTSFTKSPDKKEVKKTRPSASYDPELRQKLQHVKTEEHQMTAARVSVNKKMEHYDQVESEELLKKTKRELEHWETPDDTPTPTQAADQLSHAIDVEIPDFSQIKGQAPDEFKPPVITERLRDVKFDSDKDAVLKVKFQGFPDPDLQWFHNGNELKASDRVYWTFPDNRSCELRINNVKKSDEGQYAARVANRGGEELSTCILNVNEMKRKILEGPRSQEWSADLAARFEVVVSHKDVNGVWMKDGVAIEQTHKHIIEDIGGGRRRLTIQDLKKVDEGIYEYVYSGDRAAATLTVHQKAIEITQQLRDQMILSGEVATFECFLSDETSDGKWYKNGTEVQADNRISLITDKKRQMLIIEDCTQNDVGEYTFAVDDAQTFASLGIKSDVRIVQELESTQCVEGEQAILVCAVEPQEYSNGKWMVNGRELQMDSRMTYSQPPGGFKELVIRNVNIDDAGTYSYVAGSCATQGELFVEEIDIIEPLRDQEVEVSGEVLFETLLTHVNVSGVWCKNGVPIKLEDERCQVFIDEKVQALYLNNLCAEDAGIYSFTAGSKTTQCELLISGGAPPLEPPVITKKFNAISCKAGDRVAFECAFTGTEPQISWARNGKPINGGQIQIIKEDGYTACLIPSAQHLSSAGTYTVEIKNSAGSASNSAALSVEGSPPEVVERPEGGDWQLGTTLKLVGKMIGQPMPQVHWECAGEEITDRRFKIYEEGGYSFMELQNASTADTGKYTMVGENELGEARWTVNINVRNLTPDDNGARPQSASSQRSVEVITQQRHSEDGHRIVSNEEVEVEVPRKTLAPVQAPKKSPPVASPPSASPKRASPVEEKKEKKKKAPRILDRPEEQKMEMPTLKPVKKNTPKKPTSPTSPDFTDFEKKEDDKKKKPRRTPLKLTIPSKDPLKVSRSQMKLDRKPEAMTPLPSQGKPEFVIKPEDANIVMGSNAEIKCRIAGTPPPDVTWYKGKWGKLTAVGRISVDFNVASGVSTLKIKKIQKPDKGQYRCVAKNANGEAEANFTLNVLEKEVKVEKLDRYGLKPKKDVPKEDCTEFDAVKMLRDVDPKEYEKYANHFGVKDFRHLLTSFEEVKAEVETEEIEEVENLLTPESAISLVPEEEIWHKVIESVGKEPVDVLQDIRDIIAVTHGDAVFEAEIRINVPGIDVKWFKEDTQLHEGEKYHMTQKGDNHSLFIRNVQDDDAGNYRIEAGQAKSEAKLVYQIPRTPTPEPEIVFVQEAQKVEAAAPPKSKPKEEPKRVKTPPPSKIEKPVEKKVVRKAPTPPPPTPPPPGAPLDIYGKLEDQSVYLDDEFAFRAYCNYEEMEYAWFFKDKPLKIYKNKAEYSRANPQKTVPFVTAGTTGENYWIKCERAQKHFQGKYEIRLSNAEGDEVKSAANLTVKKHEPQFLKTLSPMNVQEGRKITFECEIDDPAQEVNWSYQGANRKEKWINPNSSGEFTVKSDDGVHKLQFTAQEAHTGTFTCKMDDSEFSMWNFNTNTMQMATSAQLTVTVEAPAPTFVKRLTDLTKHCRDHIRLEVSVSDPDCKVTWTKNDRKVSANAPGIKLEAEGITRALIIPNASFDDAARYCVEIEGEKSSCNLKILERELEVVQKLANIECPLDGDAYFETVLNGANAEPVWKKDGRQLTKSDGVDFEEEPVGDNMRYRCILKSQQVDDAGKISFSALGSQCKQNAELTVKDLPLGFTRELSDVEGVEYSNADFEAHVTHKGCVTTWLVNDQPVRASEKYQLSAKGFVRHLTITNLSLADNFKVACKVSDGDESAVTSAKLTTTQFPVDLVTGLKDQQSMVNQETVFTVQLDKPDVDHKWYVNGIEIQPSANVATQNHGTSYELIYKRPQVSNAGDIEFRANKESVKTSCKFTVKDTSGFAKTLDPEYNWEENAKLETIGCEVDKPSTEVTWWYRPGMFINPLDNRQIKEGENATLYCDCNFPDAVVIWDKDGEVLQTGNKYNMGSDEYRRTLTIKNVTGADAGRYTAKLQSNGNKTEAQITVVPSSPPPYSPPEKYRGTIDGYELDGTWEQLKDTDRLSINAKGVKREIEMRDISVQDSGEYCCKTPDSKTFGRIRVEGFVITKKLQDCEVGEKEAAEFFIEMSKPTRKITWYLKGEKLSDGGDVVIRNDKKVTTLILENCSLDMVGTVRVEAEALSSEAELGVTRDLKFTSKLEDVYATEKEDAVFEVTVSSVEAQVDWFRADMKIAQAENKYSVMKDGRKRRLTVHNVNKGDEVEFSCSLGDYTTNCNLIVEEAPVSFTAQLMDTGAQEGKTATFECSLSKDAPVKWFKNKDELKASDKYKMEADGLNRKLHINDVGYNDEARYACKAGDAKTTANLAVQTVAIEFVEDMHDQTVTEGEPVTFKIELNLPDIKPIQWFQNGMEQYPNGRVKIDSNGPTHTMTIVDPTVLDTSEIMFNAAGVRSVAKLTVEQAALRFTKELENLETENKMASVELECALSRGNANVTWFSGTSEIFPSRKFAMGIEDKKRILTIHDISYDDAGEFTCDAGDCKSTCKLSVIPANIKFNMPLEDCFCFERESKSFEVEITHVNMVGQWFFNDAEIKESKKVEMSVQGTAHILTVNDCNKDDAGKYKFVVEGKETACNFEVRDLPAKFVKRLQDESSTEKEECIFSCELNRPNVDVLWKHNGEVINARDEKYEQTADQRKRTLVIKSVAQADEGKWTCDATDDETSCELVVGGRDIRITKKMLDVEVVEGEKVVFELQLSHEDVQATWSLNGQEQKVGDNVDIQRDGRKHTFTIDKSDCKMSGTISFKCEGAKLDARLDVLEAACSFTSPLYDVTVLEGDNAVFECKVSKGGADVTWYKGRTKLHLNEKYEMVAKEYLRSLIVKSCTFDDESQFSCQVDDVKCAAKLSISTLMVDLSDCFGDQAKTVGEKVEFTVKGSEINQEARWMINGMQLRADDNIEFFTAGPVYGLRINKATIDMTGDVTVAIVNAKHTANLTVKEGAADFVTKINDIELENATKSHVFECELNRANVQVKWLRNGAEIMPSRKFDMVKRGTSCKLTISDINFDDAATYACDCGDVKTEAVMTVIEQNVVAIVPFSMERSVIERDTLDLEIELSHSDIKSTWELYRGGCKWWQDVIVGQPLVDLEGQEGKSVTLDCEISNSNDRVAWYKDGQRIMQSAQYKFIADGNRRGLTINNLSQDDGAKYMMRTSTCHETIAQLKIVSGAPASVRTLSSSSSYTPFENTPQGGGEELVASKSIELSTFRTVHSLKMFNCEMDITGDLIFRAGNCMQRCALTVRQPGAKFTKRLMDQSATETDSAIFECEISRANADVRWFHNDQEVKVEDHAKYTIEVNNRRRTLVVFNCSSADEGTVKCMSEDDECIAQLQIEGRDIKILKKLSDIEVTEGEEATFELDINYENVKGKWTLNDVACEEGDKFAIQVRGKKHILKVKSTEAAQTGMICWTSGRAKGQCNLSVLESPPSFTENLKDMTVEEKTKCVLECALNRANVKVRWLKDRRIPIQVSDKYEIVEREKIRTLIIKDLSYDDEGTYTCDAESTKSNMQLTVCARDIKLKTQMVDRTAAETTTGEMSFELTHEDVNVTWYKNGQKLAKSRTIDMVSEGNTYKLLIKEVGQDDGGVISFNAEGIQGEATLTICATPVDVMEELQRTVCREGDTVTIPCRVSDPRASGQWFLNGTKINRTERMAINNDKGLHTLKIKNATQDETGELVFICNNARSAAEVVVREQPVKFGRKMIDQNVTEKMVVEFETEVNRSNGNVEWVDAQGKVIENQGRFEVVSEGRRRRLLIDGALLADAGTITCRGVKDEEDDEINSITAQLTVKARDIKIRRHLQDAECYEGEQVDFMCDTSFGDVTPHWSLNGVLLVESEDIIFEVSGVRQRLMLKNVQADMRGKIEFYGKSSANLNVIESPVDFTEEMDNVEVEEKQMAEFKTCVTRKSAKVKWFKGRRLLKAGNKYEMIEDGPHRILRIPKTEFNDEKDYTCSCEDAVVTAKLIVHPRNIVMVSNLEDVAINEGEDAVFKCELSHDEVDAVWYRDGCKVIKSSTVIFESDGKHAKLTIKKCSQDEDDQSEIQCRCEDAISSAMLSVKSLPLNIVEPLDERYACSEGSEVSFSVKVSQPGAQGEWYMNGNQIRRSADIDIKPAKGEIHKLVMKKVHKGCVGTLKFRLARTGEECQTHVKVKGPACKVIAPLPKEVTGQEGMPLVFECKLDRKPDPDCSGWKKDGEPIEKWNPKYKFEEKDDGKFQRLIIPKVTPETAGHYSFDTGDEETLATALVKGKDGKVVKPADPPPAKRGEPEEPPKFVTELKDKRFKTGQEKSVLECEVSTHKAEVQWKKDGKVLSTSDHIEIVSAEKARSLIIKDGTEADKGEYSCELLKGGKTSCRVTFMDSPFETDPTDAIVFMGDEVYFECRVKESDAQCQWSVNGKTQDDRFVTPKASGFDRKLTVKNAQMADTGKIMCHVKGHEQKPVECTLKVIEHLKISTELAKWEGKETTDVRFTVKANKECSPTWYYNRKQITDKRFSQTKSDDGTEFNLAFVAHADDDEAKIEVTLGGELKEFVSSDTTMRVESKGTPPKIGILEHEVVLPVGAPANVCFELKGKPAAEATVTNIDNNKEYKIERSPDVKVQRFIAIDRVERGDAGSYKITAKNENGEDIQLINVVVIDKPGKPENLMVTKMTNDSCGFSWSTPADNGGDAIKRYSIEHKIAGDEWKQQFTASDECEHMLTKLPQGKMIELRIAAENKAGLGEYCSPFGPVAITDGVFPPSPPRDVIVDFTGVRKDSVPLSWQVPSADGGSPISGYEIEKCIDGSDSFESCGSCGTETSFVVKDPAVKDGKTYKFRVKAKNQAGTSGPSDMTPNVLVEDPTNKPQAPSQVIAENPTTESIDVSWNAPVNSTVGVDHYLVEMLQHGKDEWVQCAKVPSLELSTTVESLESETKYIFRVFAENDCGKSVPSEMSNPCITLTGSAPDIEPDLVCEETEYKVAKGAPFNARIKVTGRPKCECEWQKDGKSWWEYARYGGGFAQIAVPAISMADGGQYELIAKNRAGEKRANITIIVLDVPSAPQNLNVARGPTIDFSWESPKSVGGEPIVGYVVEYRIKGTPTWIEAGRPDGREWPFADLAQGETFEFRVAAYNSIGTGDFAMYDKPVGTGGGMVTNLRVVRTSDDSVTIAWDPPSNPELTACGGYMVEKLKEEETFFQVHDPGHPSKNVECTVKPLELMSRWQFRVKCISEAGPGEPCAPTDWITVQMDKLPPAIELWEGAAEGLNVKVTQTRMVMPAKLIGRPAPDVTWVKEDYPLSVDARVSIKTTDKQSTFTMADLNRSDSGVYTIIAENEHGRAEKKINVNVMDKPGIPEDFDIVDITNKSCKLVWKEPLDVGGAPIRTYFVEKREVGRQVWGKMSSEVKHDAFEYTADRLVEGREYEFRVCARNDLGYGEGALSAPIIASYLFDAPEQMDAPQVLDTTISKNGMSVKWIEPEWNGGSVITGYWLEMSSPESSRWSKVNRKPIESGKRMFKIAGLKEGRDYIFRVCAENLAGQGVWSEPSEPETACDPMSTPGRPGRPEILAVGTSTATLKWKAPSLKKGAGPPDGYILEMRKRNQTDQEEEAERRRQNKEKAKLAKQTWTRRLPDFHEVEIASPKLELECEINSTVTDSIHWKKDGKRLKQGDGVEFIEMGNTRKLVIRRNISENDAGTYTAKVGAKKCECKVSISLFAVNDNNSNNANANNNNNAHVNHSISVHTITKMVVQKSEPKNYECSSSECAQSTFTDTTTSSCGSNTGSGASSGTDSTNDSEESDDADENAKQQRNSSNEQLKNQNCMHPD